MLTICHYNAEKRTCNEEMQKQFSIREGMQAVVILADDQFTRYGKKVTPPPHVKIHCLMQAPKSGGSGELCGSLILVPGAPYQLVEGQTSPGVGLSKGTIMTFCYPELAEGEPAIP